ncbi:MAG: hypothetical protein R3F13_00235 [Prosthecobacter sp.]
MTISQPPLEGSVVTGSELDELEGLSSSAVLNSPSPRLAEEVTSLGGSGLGAGFEADELDVEDFFELPVVVITALGGLTPGGAGAGFGAGLGSTAGGVSSLPPPKIRLKKPGFFSPSATSAIAGWTAAPDMRKPSAKRAA